MAGNVSFFGRLIAKSVLRLGSNCASMGKVMGLASAQLGGTAEGK
jgi:hypothetical protein